MTPTSLPFDDANRALTALLDAIAPDQWTDPSPCDDWAARDVLAHLIQTQRHYFAEHGVDLGEEPDLVGDPALAWRDHAARVRAACADEAVTGTAFDGYFGPTTIGANFDRFYVWDMIVHRWDIATAVGADAALTAAELDHVEAGAAGFGESLYMEGICHPAVDVPADAPRTASVLARLGRRA